MGSSIPVSSLQWMMGRESTTTSHILSTSVPVSVISSTGEYHQASDSGPLKEPASHPLLSYTSLPVSVISSSPSGGYRYQASHRIALKKVQISGIALYISVYFVNTQKE